MPKTGQQKTFLLIIIGVFLVLVFWLYQVFTGKLLLNPIAGSWGGIEIRWYGLIITLAVIVAWHWSLKRFKDTRVNIEKTEKILLLAILGGIIGARFGYIIQNLSFFLESPVRIFHLTEGGLSIHGAILVGFVSIWTFSQRLGIDWRKILDATAPPLLLAMAIGRWGNFTNYEILGWPTDLPWKMFVPSIYRPEIYVAEPFFHPFFLYESILDLIGLIFLTEFHRTHFDGEIFLRMLIVVSFNRFIVEFFRINDFYLGTFSLAQLVSLSILVLAGILLWLVHRRRDLLHQ